MTILEKNSINPIMIESVHIEDDYERVANKNGDKFEAPHQMEGAVKYKDEPRKTVVVSMQSGKQHRFQFNTEEEAADIVEQIDEVVHESLKIESTIVKPSEKKVPANKPK